MYLSLYKALISLQLGFARASGANATSKPFQVAPLSGKTRDKVLMLSQLHLQLTVVGSGSLGKDIQNQSYPVNYLYLKGCLYISLLER
jgi:hypothetical protein